MLPHRLKKLRWGVAGCGKYTETDFLSSFQQLKRSTAVAVFSHDINRAKCIADKFAAPHAFNDYDEFLKSDFNALYIGSNNADHYWQVIKAAKAGKNILCEKPLALNSTQAKEMVEVCEKHGVYLMLNYNNRFHPLIQKTKELLSKQMLGKLISVSAAFNIDLPPNENFRFKKELSGGGAMRDLGTHMIDTLRYIGGEIKDGCGYIDNVIYMGEVDDFASGMLKFATGGYGYFNVSFNCKKAFNRIEVVGHKGCLSIENVIGKKNAPAKLIINLDGEAKRAFRRRANKQTLLLRDFQHAILKREPPLISGRDGLINMQIMEKLENKK
ncbi:MAG: Gfo/Idh/MocA family oxidoreductase [bacterium]